ncbi:MAG TPA: hypothetical protein VK669_02050 [Candidatus Limnocylindrales bacterium]|nr:hypothetical protein [Candidatus Limnocylindrales bacterium]
MEASGKTGEIASSAHAAGTAQYSLDESERRQLLKDEYLHLQKTFVDLDGRAITIKAWTASFSLAALTGAFAAHSSLVFLLSSFSAFVFCLIEVMWKQIQYAFYGRSTAIERFFAGLNPDIAPFQIDHYWVQSHKERDFWSYVQILLKPHVFLPHGPIAVVGIILFIMATLKWLSL